MQQSQPFETIGLFCCRSLLQKFGAFLGSPEPPACGRMTGMKRDDIIQTLREREADLRAQGIVHAALFGSVARGEDRPDSDIDILVDLDPAVVRTMFDYVGVKDFIADMFDRPVDVVSNEGLKPRVRPRATADAIYAF
jgi:uncharacterized protein